MARSLPTTGKIPRIRQLCLERITCSQLPTANRHPVGVDSWLAGGRLWIAISVFCLPFRSRSLFLRPFMHNTAAAVVRAVVMAVASLAAEAFPGILSVNPLGSPLATCLGIIPARAVHNLKGTRQPRRRTATSGGGRLCSRQGRDV